MNALATIHIAKKELGIDSVAYEAMLSPYGVTSSKDLSYAQQLELIATFEKIGFKIKIKKPLKYADLKEVRYADSGERLATPAQLRMIDALWMTSPAVRNKTEEGMNNFTNRIAGVNKIEWLTMRDVRRVVKAIKGL
jgi:phage gp16-like protein